MKTASNTTASKRTILFLTLFFVYLGLLIPKSLVTGILPFLGIILVLTGVPHGAVDFYLFRQLRHSEGKPFHSNRFFGGYMLLIVVYVLTWSFAPILAFIQFLLVSAYHFGQSNWVHVHFDKKIQEVFYMLLWGSGIIGVPVLLHFQQAATIISEMTGWLPALSDTVRASMVFLLIFSNIAGFIHLYHDKTITSAVFREELWKFLLLQVLFFTTPLLVGFGVYFVLWHSLSSMYHQIEALGDIQKGWGVKNYLLKSLPLSFISFLGLGILYFFFGNGFNQGQNLGVLFLFIAVITVPHTALMEWLYRERKMLALPTEGKFPAQSLSRKIPCRSFI